MTVTAEMAQRHFMGARLHALTMRQALAHVRATLAAGGTVNAASLNVAKLVNLRRDPDLRRDLDAASLVLPDGMGVVWGARMLGLRVPERVAGIDLMDRMLAACAEQGWRPYFLGARQEIVQRAVAAACARYPGLVFAGWQDGYFSSDEAPSVVAAIGASGADCLFVGMPSPKKERFLACHGAELQVPFLMGVGGSLDILAGATSRAPRIWQNAGLEWLYRTIQEPRRMLRRYLSTNVRFAGLLAVALAARWLRQARTILDRPRVSAISATGRSVPFSPNRSPDEAIEGVQCRKIRASDLQQVEALLREGFTRRPADWFGRALASLSRHEAPPGFPQFGYLLQCGDDIVGALLVIVSCDGTAGSGRLRRNASCWYVRPAFRIYAPVLIDHGVRRSAATDVNISPATHTWPILEAQGFRQFSHGLFIGLPLLHARRADCIALSWRAAKAAGWPISAAQAAFIEAHEAFGCFSLVCRDARGLAVCVFRKRRFRGVPLPGAQIIFCEAPDDVARFAAVIGFALLRRGCAWLALTVNAPVAGLRGLWFPGRAPMYFRGADEPAPSDLLYTEAALFGF